MAKPSRWKRIKNWFYDKWMRLRGYKPYMWDMNEHLNTYIKAKEIDEMVREAEKEEPEYEKIFYKRQPAEPGVCYRDKERDNIARMVVAKALREGKDDARIICRPLPRE